MARIKLTPAQIGLLSVSVFMLAAAIIGLSVFFGSSSQRRSALGTKAPSGASTRIPRTAEYAFNVSENLRICGLRTERVSLTPNISDYAVLLNVSAGRLSIAGGGTLALDEGVYLISRQIFIPSGVCVRGRGMKRTTLRMAPRSSPLPLAGMVRVQNAERVSLIDFTVDGANDTQLHNTAAVIYGRYGLYATSFKYLWIRGVRMTNNYAYGFDPHGTRDTWSHYLVIEGCVADNNGLDGFTLDQTRHISLLDSKAFNNYRHGVNIVTGSADVLVRRVLAENNGVDPMRRDVGCGIIVQNNEKELQTRDCVLDSNTLVDSPRAGVCVSDSVNVTISNTNTTITKFLDAPCYLLRRSREVFIRKSTCTTVSRRRVSDDNSTTYEDDMSESIEKPAPRSVTRGKSSDPACGEGIRANDGLNGDVCCPKECGRCGGDGCSRLPVDALCCTSAIRASGRPCDKYEAPCIIPVMYLKPTPHVHISFAPPLEELPSDVNITDVPDTMPQMTAMAIAETS